MKKKIFLVVLSVLLLLMSCGKTETQNAQRIEGTFIQTLDIPRTAVLEKNSRLYVKDEPGISGSMILEDDTAIYQCSIYQIMRIEKESGESRILWESVEAQNGRGLYPDMCESGSAVLWGEKIYFIEQWEEEPGLGIETAFSVINCDGSGYNVIGEVNGSIPTSLYLNDDILCVADYRFVEYYRISGEGTPVKIGEEEAGVPMCMPEEYIHTYYNGSGPQHLCIAQSMWTYGYALVRDHKGHYIRLLPEMGEEEIQLPGRLFMSLNQECFLSWGDHNKLYLTDAKTLETRLLSEYEDESVINVTDMDNDCACVQKMIVDDHEGLQYYYEKLDLNTGESTPLFSQSYESRLPVTLCNGFVYYAEKENGQWYLMSRDLAQPSEEERLGEPFYDSGWSKVGTTERVYERFYDKKRPDVRLAEATAEWIKIDQRFPGAEKINRKLKDAEESEISGIKGTADEQLSGDELLDIYYSYSSAPSPIFYYDGRYVSFYQDQYYYLGGAHGIPVRSEYTFDLETGRQLALKDIIGNSEEELRELVTAYFAEYIGQNPGYFAKDAVNNVRENTDFDIFFYLTDKGITFEFSPYTLASFAAGYQNVTIPYEEFDMKLPIGLE